MSSNNAPADPENAKEGPSSAKKPRAKEFASDQPRSIRFSDSEIAVLNHIHKTFPHLTSQVDAVRYAVRCFAAKIPPSPIQFRSLDAAFLFIVQGVLDEIGRAHRHNREKTLKLRPKDEAIQGEAYQTLKVIESETEQLARATRDLSAHCKLSSNITPDDIQNIRAFLGRLEESIKKAQDVGRDKEANLFLSVQKTLKGLIT